MLSPLSVSMALGMTSNGAAGQTLEAMRNTLEFKNFTEAQVNSYYQHLLTDLPQLDPLATVKIANSIWYRNGLTVAAPFLQINTSQYKATVAGLDFNNPVAKDQINTWVSSQTNNKIPTIVNEINPDVMMYLINAVYFKSSWKYQFDKSKTVKDAFMLENGNTIQADFMTAHATVNTAQTADANIFELPYGNSKYSMVIVLPKAGKTVAGVTSTLDTTQWKNAMAGASSITTDVHLPKFKFSYESQLKNTLKALGMNIAFSDQADFSRMISNMALNISEVKHKGFIEVNEEGTEATAVTSVGMSVTSVNPSANININRPFLFVIREMKTGLLLFTGIVNNPLLNG